MKDCALGCVALRLNLSMSSGNRAGKERLGSCSGRPSSGPSCFKTRPEWPQKLDPSTGSSLAQLGCIEGYGQRTTLGGQSPLGPSGFNSVQHSFRAGSTGQENANPTLGCGSGVRAEGKTTRLPQNSVRKHFTLHLCRGELWTTSWASHEKPGFPPQHQGCSTGLRRAQSSFPSPGQGGQGDGMGQRVPHPPGHRSAKATACTGNRKPSARSPARDGKARLWAETVRPRHQTAAAL